MKNYRTGMAVALLLWMTLAGAQAPPPAPASTQRFTANWQNVDILTLVDAVSKATGLEFIPDARVRGPATLISPNSKPLTAQELYERLLQTLQVMQFATSRTGNVVRIVPETNITRMPGITIPERINPNSEEYVTTVINLKNVSALQLNTVLRQLIPNTSFMTSVQGTNALIINDRASNVARVQKIVAELDGGTGSGVDMIALKNSNATEVARTLTTLTTGNPQDAAAAGGAPKVVADERTNSILVSGDVSARQRVAAYVADLDKPVADDDNIETRYLKYADAETVATTLSGQASSIIASTSGNAGAAAPAGPGGAASASSSGGLTDRTVKIQADKTTNMLIISAPLKTRKSLMRLVDQMDIPRATVLLEAIIADMTIDKSNDLGVNWAAFSQENGKVIPGALFNAPVGSSAPLDLAGLAQAVDNPGSVTSVPAGAIFGVGKLVDDGISWAAMIRAVLANTNTNVIANPRQMTLDNEQATLTSGQNVPFLSGQYTNSGNNTGGGGGNINPFSTVQRQDIGTTLKITPRLNGSDKMTLTIDLESSELAGQTGDAGSQITNKRTFHNMVIVKDQQWLVVGGMIRDSEAVGENRVPLLSRIPLLGNLFKVKNKRRQKSNLMVFIKPTIITDDLQAEALTGAKYKELQDMQEIQRTKGDLPSPKLPSLDPSPVAAPPRTNGVPQTSPVP